MAHETALGRTSESRVSQPWCDAKDLLGERLKHESLPSLETFSDVPGGSCGVVQEQEDPLLLVVLPE